MLTAERIKTRTVHGRAERYFSKPDGTRNEALDCRAYATAALHALYMAGFKLHDQAGAHEKHGGRQTGSGAGVSGVQEPIPNGGIGGLRGRLN